MPRTIHVFSTVMLVLALGAPVANAASLPSHPDKLKFPEQTFAPPQAKDHRVELENGIVAYMVPDPTLPLVTVRVFMRIGPDLDPKGKEGLAQGVVHLLTRSGTASSTAKDLEDRSAFLGARLDSRMGPGGGGFFGIGAPPVTPAESRAEINLLSKDVDEGLAILAECLRAPAFEQDRLDLAREQALQEIKERNDDSRTIEDYAWGYLIRGEDHWTNRHMTKASVESITRDDLMAFHRRYVGPKNFLIAVSGDFDRQAMQDKLEKVFADWPTPGENPGPPAAPATEPEAGFYMTEKDVNQGRVTIGLRAFDRYDADWIPAQVMNLVLGGGGFSSRLVNKIRSDEGLAYSVRSQFVGGHYYGDAWQIRFQSKVRSVPYAIDLALQEVERMRTAEVTAEELALAKNLLIESLPAFFETADGIAGVLAVEELTGRYARDPAYYANLRDRVHQVTREDVKRVATRLLDPARMVTLCVGDTEEMLKGDSKHDSSIRALAGGEPTRLPLRDPFTMTALPNP